ncbi:MAG: universal stress protein [Ekhidna sp.]
MISTLKKIIVCLDHTDIDKTLMKSACEISKAAGTTSITFLNVIKDFNLPDGVKKDFPELLQKALEERKKDIDNQIEKYFTCDTPNEVVVLQGNATKEILKTANKLQADLIILGRKKVSDSVLSTRIARRSPCSLLLVPENSQIKLDNVFVPIDFSDYSHLSLKTALSITKGRQSNVFLQNVYNVPSSYRYSGKTFEQFAEIMKEHAGKDLGALLKQVESSDQELIPVYTLDKAGHIIKLVYSEAKKKKADLIVMGAKGKTIASAILIGSKSERMIRINDEIPLLMIRKKGAVTGLLDAFKEL